MVHQTQSCSVKWLSTTMPMVVIRAVLGLGHMGLLSMEAVPVSQASKLPMSTPLRMLTLPLSAPVLIQLPCQIQQPLRYTGVVTVILQDHKLNTPCAADTWVVCTSQCAMAALDLSARTLTPHSGLVYWQSAAMKCLANSNIPLHLINNWAHAIIASGMGFFIYQRCSPLLEFLGVGNDSDKDGL